MTHPIDLYFQNVPGETRQTLARRANLSEMHLSRIIRGDGEVSTKSLRAVSQATGGVVSVADLASAFERAAAAAALKKVKEKRKARSKPSREPTAA